MIEVELGDEHCTTCECCGGETVSLTRFVYKDGDAFAIYYACFSSTHQERIVDAVVSIGDWGSDAEPVNRCAFALRIRSGPENYEVMVTDAGSCRWSKVELLGRKLGREEALAHRWIDDVFHITDHMCAEDGKVKAFLDQPRGKPN